MENKRFAGRAFFTELIIGLVVFSLMCAALAGVYSRVLVSSRQMKEEKLASAEVIYLLELVKSGEVEFEADGSDSVLVFYYNQNWRQAEKVGHSYFVEIIQTVVMKNAGEMHEYTAHAYNADGGKIFTLTMLNYAPLERGNEVA